ncbi:MAG: P-II family nitrogen regulator [Deltaproteobacteria bacterium]|nr:P-II family nitrogen regulator [Deltaproteobacteria bacterium]
MKEIKAIIQPFMLQHVLDALKQIPDMPGVTVSEVKGFGRGRAEHSDKSETAWGSKVVPKLKVETVVTDAMAGEVINAIQKFAHTGNIGDGKIFVYSVSQVIKIRTGESGQVAL